VIEKSNDNKERQGTFHAVMRGDNQVTTLEIILPVKGSKTATRNIGLPYSYIFDMEYNPEGIFLSTTRRSVVIKGDNLYPLFEAIRDHKLRWVKQSRKEDAYLENEPRPHTIEVTEQR